jgi:hypothetical protein
VAAVKDLIAAGKDVNEKETSVSDCYNHSLLPTNVNIFLSIPLPLHLLPLSFTPAVACVNLPDRFV